MKLILVCSLKGGVGKTTVCVGLAKALRRLGLRTAILDADYRTPDLCIAFGEEAERAELTRAPGDLIVPPTVEGIQIMSMAYLWSPDSCVEVSDEDALDNVAHLLTPGVIQWNPEYLLVDTPPTATGQIRAALESPDILGAVVVSHPSKVARADCRRTVDMFRQHRVPVIVLVSNMGVDAEGRQMFDLRDGDMEAFAREYGLPAFFALPYMLDGDRRDGLFDALATLVLETTPKVLERHEPGDAAWKAAVQLARRLKK